MNPVVVNTLMKTLNDRNVRQELNTRSSDPFDWFDSLEVALRNTNVPSHARFHRVQHRVFPEEESGHNYKIVSYELTIAGIYVNKNVDKYDFSSSKEAFQSLDHLLPEWVFRSLGIYSSYLDTLDRNLRRNNKLINIMKNSPDDFSLLLILDAYPSQNLGSQKPLLEGKTHPLLIVPNKNSKSIDEFSEDENTQPVSSYLDVNKVVIHEWETDMMLPYSIAGSEREHSC